VFASFNDVFGFHVHRGMPEGRPDLRDPSHTLIAVPSPWAAASRRDLIRERFKWCVDQLIPVVQWNIADVFTMRFFMGDLPHGNGREAAVWDYMTHYSDSVALFGVVDTDQEGVNARASKLLPIFRWVTSRLQGPNRLGGAAPPRFLVMLDDESFVRLGPLHNVVSRLPRRRVYAGAIMDSLEVSKEAEPHSVVQTYPFALGLGFVLSWDLVLHLAESGLPLKTDGGDDIMLGMWLSSLANLQYFDLSVVFHAHPGENTHLSRDCSPDSVIIHGATEARCEAQPWCCSCF